MNDSEQEVCRRQRREQVREVIARLGLDGIALRTYPNVAWYTGGAETRVDHSSPYGVATAVVTRDGDLILADNIEAQRLRDEQVPGYTVEEHPWYTEPPLEQVAGQRIGTDFPWPGAVDAGAEIARLRTVLDAAAVEQYRSVGAAAQDAMQDAAGRLQPGMTEWAMQAELEAACRRRGLYSPVAMAAADDRIAAYRHPVTAGATAQSRVMLVVCAERYGLYANLTSWVHFEPPGQEWRERQSACEWILREARERVTVPGISLAEAFAGIQALYAEAGYPDQWRYHHQGGTTGYATREHVATPQTDERIVAGNAFAWNPSILGAKAEETFVLTEQGPLVVAAGSAGLSQANGTA